MQLICALLLNLVQGTEGHSFEGLQLGRAFMWMVVLSLFAGFAGFVWWRILAMSGGEASEQQNQETQTTTEHVEQGAEIEDETGIRDSEAETAIREEASASSRHVLDAAEQDRVSEHVDETEAQELGLDRDDELSSELVEAAAIPAAVDDGEDEESDETDAGYIRPGRE